VLAANSELNLIKTKIDKGLAELCEQSLPANLDLAKSIQYALLGSGKRLRPLLFLTTIKDLNHNYKDFMSFALGLECLHSYSLIHDDLPALDNDKSRRGQPTLHVKYDEATAILAGDALLTLSFELAAKPLPIAPSIQLKMISQLATLAGRNNLILGQHLDLELQKSNRAPNSNYIDEIVDINLKKTASLFQASINSALIAFELDTSNYSELNKLARIVGLHFQFKDDLFEENMPNSARIVNQLSKVEAELFRLCNSLGCDFRLLLTLIKQIIKRTY